MSKKNIFSVVLCIIFILSLSFKSSAYRIKTKEKINSGNAVSQNNLINSNNKKEDLIKKIIKNTRGNIVEYGVMAQFDDFNRNKKTADGILKKLDDSEKIQAICYKNSEENYSIEIQGNSLNGYIESTKYGNHNIIKIDIVKNCGRYGLYDLQHELDSILKVYSTNIRYFKYIKVKIENNNMEEIYKNTIGVLKEYGTRNIKTQQIENGYTSTAYTGRYEKIYSNSEPMDFNFAIVQYSTGIYVIMGTPEIMETY